MTPPTSASTSVPGLNLGNRLPGIPEVNQEVAFLAAMEPFTDAGNTVHRGASEYLSGHWKALLDKMLSPRPEAQKPAVRDLSDKLLTLLTPGETNGREVVLSGAKFCRSSLRGLLIAVRKIEDIRTLNLEGCEYLGTWAAADIDCIKKTFFERPALETIQIGGTVICKEDMTEEVANLPTKSPRLTMKVGEQEMRYIDFSMSTASSWTRTESERVKPDCYPERSSRVSLGRRDSSPASTPRPRATSLSQSAKCALRRSTNSLGSH